MASLLGLTARIYLCIVLVVSAVPALAAPFAAHVMDARTGETLYSKNADTRLHPASLTKMLTLYIAFEAIERGEITLDTRITISAHAASQPPSRLGLKAGQKVALRYLIRAAAIKSANDAATAIAEGISGSEGAFAKRMNRTAKAIGMTNSTFKNANGLTVAGHLSTARDMSTLGRRLFYDFPQYYNIFSRRSADAKLAEVANTNRRFLDSYEGADGIKTGYTVAAGFNLTASAERGGKRIIATVFGGTSTANRNARVAELLDAGFGQAPRNAPEDPPDALVYADVGEELTPETGIDVETADGAGKTIRLVTTLKVSPRPRSRPTSADVAVAVASATAATAATVPEAATADPEATAAEAAVLAMADGIEGAVAQANEPIPFAMADGSGAAAPDPAVAAAVAAATAAEPAAQGPAVVFAEAAPVMRPLARPTAVADASATAAAIDIALAAAAPAADELPDTAAGIAAAADLAVAEVVLADATAADPIPFQVIDAPAAGDPDALPFALVDPADLPLDGAALVQEAAMLAFIAPVPRPAAPEPEANTELAVLRPAPSPEDAPLDAAEPEVVTRISTSGGRHFGISLGQFDAHAPAERILMKTMLAENATLREGLRKIVQRNGEYDATVMGLSEDQANLACRRLRARAMECETIGP